jgi:hypothetical protein
MGNGDWPGLLQDFIATHSAVEVYRSRRSAGLDRCKRLRLLIQSDPNLLLYLKREQGLLAFVRSGHRGDLPTDGA